MTVIGTGSVSDFAFLHEDSWLVLVVYQLTRANKRRDDSHEIVLAEHTERKVLEERL